MKYLLPICFLFSCNGLPLDHPIENTYNGYVIEKGNRYASGRYLLPKDGSLLKFDAIFLPSAWYEAKDSAIHKLYGFTDVNSTVHGNSVRFGWRCSNRETIDIFAYWYTDGKMSYRWMGETKPEVENRYSIEAAGNYYQFRFNNRILNVKRTIRIESGVRSRLFPYFEDGKGNGAPHEMTIYIFEYK